jgi:flagellar biosynthesis/type III secretory pathway protein FliH
MDAAKIEAAKLIAAADDRGYSEGRERGLREGSEIGRAEGLAEARAQHDEQLRTLLDRWQEALIRWEEERSSMLLPAREDVLTFAYELARKVVLKLPEFDQEIVQRQIAEAVSLLMRPSALEVLIHPDDRPFVEELLPDIVKSIHHGVHATLATDESMARGGCIVRSGAGRIDATLETQLDRLADALLAARDASPPAEPRDRRSRLFDARPHRARRGSPVARRFARAH